MPHEDQTLEPPIYPELTPFLSLHITNPYLQKQFYFRNSLILIPNLCSTGWLESFPLRLGMTVLSRTLKEFSLKEVA